MKLFIEDTGRDYDYAVGVQTEDGQIAIHSYTVRDLTRTSRLSNAWWKRNGYRGRLVITDSDEGKTYVVNVK